MHGLMLLSGDWKLPKRRRYVLKQDSGDRGNLDAQLRTKTKETIFRMAHSGIQKANKVQKKARKFTDDYQEVLSVHRVLVGITVDYKSIIERF